MENNLIYGFASLTLAVEVMGVLARTTGTGGKKCFVIEEKVYSQPIDADNDARLPEFRNQPKVDRCFELRFLADQYRKQGEALVRVFGYLREPPHASALSFFVRGYLKGKAAPRGKNTNKQVIRYSPPRPDFVNNRGE